MGLHPARGSSAPAAAVAAMPNGPRPANSDPADEANPSKKYPAYRAAFRRAGFLRSDRSTASPGRPILLHAVILIPPLIMLT